jgi:hypothetical protein
MREQSWSTQGHDCSFHQSSIHKRNSAASPGKSMAAHARASTKQVATMSRIVLSLANVEFRTSQ